MYTEIIKWSQCIRHQWVCVCVCVLIQSYRTITNIFAIAFLYQPNQQVHIAAAYSWQRWKGLSIPWYVSHDQRQSGRRGAWLHILLRCNCIVAKSTQRLTCNDPEDIARLQDAGGRRELATICWTIPTEFVGTAVHHVRDLKRCARIGRPKKREEHAKYI